MVKSTAHIIQSSICRTKTHPRPYPSLFYFPGLNSQPVYNANDFKHSNLLSTKTTSILNEYKQWKESNQMKSDYKMIKDEHKLHDGNWEWNSYVLKGKKQADFAVNCPQTTTVLESIPSLMHSVPFSYTFFSTLKANTKIAAHYGPCNIRLRCHLPLQIPEGDCGINIAGVNMKWETGVPLIFDDTYEHFVWNNTNEDRVILLIDLWHPDLVPDEIQAITRMFHEYEEERKKNRHTLEEKIKTIKQPNQVVN